MSMKDYKGVHVKVDPMSEMSPEEQKIFQDAIDRGAIEYTPYDDRKAIKQIEQLFNAYINIPDEALNNALERAGKKFKDDAFDEVWENTLKLAASDPKAKEILYKAIQSNEDLKKDFDARANEEAWTPEMEEDWGTNDTEYEFGWGNGPSDDAIKKLEQQLDEDGDGEVTIDEVTDDGDSVAHAVSESKRVKEEHPDDDESEVTWSIISNALKDRHF